MLLDPAGAEAQEEPIDWARARALHERVRRGEEVFIGKAGKPVARLVRYERHETERRPGALAGKITIADDFDRLPDDIAEAFGVREP